jgi:hypothetical protein
MNTWTKETDKILLEMWGKSGPDEIAVAVSNWHRDNSLSKGGGHSPITTARGVMYHALKFGLVSSEEVSAFDKQQNSERAKRGYVSNEISRAVLQRDNNQCLLCGSKDNLAVTHIVPVSRGGNSKIDNLQTLCVSCRKDVHGSEVDFRKPYVKEWCNHCGREHYKNIESQL